MSWVFFMVPFVHELERWIEVHKVCVYVPLNLQKCVHVSVLIKESFLYLIAPQCYESMDFSDENF